MNYKKTTLFYFSGTGNAKKVSEWIAEAGEENNCQVNIHNLDEIESRRKIKLFDTDLVGFASATHGFNFPPIMLHFIWHFPKARKGQKAFIINTRAGMKMGPWFLPGISGIAQILSALILLLKGYAIVAMKPIDLPSNWISLHPGLRQKVVDSIYKKREQTTKSFARNLFQGRRNYRALFDLIQDLAIAPIAFLYYLLGRFVLAKTFYASSVCTHCGLCIKKCPVQAISYVHNRPYWSYKCESCMRCMNACPVRAIETAHGFIIGFVILFDAILLNQINKWIGFQSFIDHHFSSGIAYLLNFLIYNILFVAFLFALYRLMYVLIQFKWIEKIILYTSFTKYAFWRRYKPRKK